MSAHIVNDVVEGAVAAVLVLLVTMGAHIVNDVVEGAVAACVITVYYGCP